MKPAETTLFIISLVIVILSLGVSIFYTLGQIGL